MLNDKSRMKGDFQVRFREKFEVKVLLLTRLRGVLSNGCVYSTSKIEILTSEHYEILWNKYSVLQEIEKCIREFREIFRTKKMPLRYLFIERYKNSSIKELASFANGLEKDISAVENAVASDLSNAFVEGTNSKVKMAKRTMYGRCSKKLLTAKLMYSPA